MGYDKRIVYTAKVECGLRGCYPGVHEAILEPRFGMSVYSAMAFAQTIHTHFEDWAWEKADDVVDSIKPGVSSFRQAKKNVLHAIDDLPEGQVWTRIGKDVSAIGNLLLHLAGSEHQWIANKIGGHPLKRDRPLEFATRGGATLRELRDKWIRTGEISDEVLHSLREDDVRKPCKENLSVLFILHYCIHHVSVHLGQIIGIREFLTPGFRMYGGD